MWYTLIGHAVDRNFNLSYVGVKVVFRVPSSWIVGVDEQKQDALERPALGVHLQRLRRVSEPRVMGTTSFTHDKVVRELLAT